MSGKGAGHRARRGARAWMLVALATIPALGAAPAAAEEERAAELRQAERIDRAMEVLDDPLSLHLATELPRAPSALRGEPPFLQEPPRAQEDFSQPSPPSPPQQQGP